MQIGMQFYYYVRSHTVSSLFQSKYSDKYRYHI
nr:MAG TPA: hypothetical protein [Caudoviricetes sp.]